MNKLITCNLQLFAEGSEGAAGATGIAGSAAESAAAGQVAADTGATAAEGSNNADAQRAADWDAMISGEYKENYQKSLQKDLGRRLKTRDRQIAEADAFKNSVTPLLDMLAVKYGVNDASNIEAIRVAANKDDSFYETYALQRGVDVETAKQLLAAEKITAENDRRQADEERQREFQQKYQGWLNEAAELKQVYPQFDFDEESMNPVTGETFRTLVNSGVSVRNAYEALHTNEIFGGAMQYAYNSAKQEMADARTARQQRVNENGTSSQQASALHYDMSKLNAQQRAKLRAAVARGERINESNFTEFI